MDPGAFQSACSRVQVGTLPFDLERNIKIHTAIGKPQPHFTVSVSKLERQFVAELQSDERRLLAFAPGPLSRMVPSPSDQIPPFFDRTNLEPPFASAKPHILSSIVQRGVFFCHLCKNRSSCCRTSSPCSRPRLARTRSRPCLGLAHQKRGGGRPCFLDVPALAAAGWLPLVLGCLEGAPRRGAARRCAWVRTHDAHLSRERARAAVRS